jgi:hypothetical protein
MMVRVVLRTVAVAIAAAALIDPAITSHRVRPGELTVVAMDDGAVAAAARVTERLSTRGATTWVYQPVADAAACPSSGACVIVSTGDAPRQVTAGADLIGVVKVAADGSADTPRITSIHAPTHASRDEASTIGVRVSSPIERVEIFDGPTMVGAVETDNTMEVEVPWVPISDGARALRVVAGAAHADVGVVVSSTPVPVLFYEPQATWLGTFVRRSLGDDSRFRLRGRTRLAPMVTISRGDAGPLTAATVEAFGVIVLSAPELVTSAEVGLLEQFVAERGGTLIALADKRPGGAVSRLLPQVTAERRDPDPQSIGSLRATEWLTFGSAPGLSVLAAVDQQPVIVARPLGRGRVIVSGALDAWRYRQAEDGFDEFWKTLVWEGAMLAGPRLRVEAEPVLARPGAEVTILAELQSLTGAPVSEVEAAGEVVCGEDRQFLRLWPGARVGTVTGRLRVDTESECVVSVRIGRDSGSTPVTFRDDLHRPATEDERLDALAAAHGLEVIGDEDMTGLIARAEALTAEREPTPLHPMRSPWWLVPFAACLGGEWWLRRRSGLS